MAMYNTRSASKASLTGADAHSLDPKSELTNQLSSTLENLDDNSTVQGRDAKLLRDATAQAIVKVWTDTCTATALLTRKINEGNNALTEKLNASFSAVEDVMRARPVFLTEEQTANFLIGHLEGVAREKVEVEEPSESDKKSYDAIVAHLKAYFENPQQRYVARQQLSVCHQEQGETCSAFANRVLNLVRAATSGQDSTTQKERQAVTKAQMVEQLLSEAAAEKLMNPTKLAPEGLSLRGRNRRMSEGPAKCYNCGSVPIADSSYARQHDHMYAYS
ncbi:hypothetical protein OESDEN_03068 [Oesophagostomum dentatum]|uniref:Retrotransposon gag domain-containing protein n=1 Tax=Oesophagostomum dentatum TaxID=61180 RepID=A0A0B1TI75_OESDE|nr:hypothetical protein OESDEN_03068 [Oesophagostomum dentatum]